MKTISVTALSLVLVTACSFGADPSAPLPAAEPPASPPPQAPTSAPPGAPPLDGTPETSDLTEQLGIFVAESGSDDGDGSRAHPLRSLQKAIGAAALLHKRVYACAGTYSEAITLSDGIPMLGALTCASGQWAVGTEHAKIVAPTSPAVRADAIKTVARVDGFDITAPDATAPSGSSIGVLVTDSPALTFANARITAGRGADGVAGVEGVQLVKRAVKPATNSTGQELYPCDPVMGCGGLNGTFPRLPGGSGAQNACDGAPGHDPEVGGTGGSGGVWKLGDFGWNHNSTDPATWQSTGEKKGGARGASGVDGVTSAWSFTRDGFVPGDGATGTDGKPGAGGNAGDGQKVPAAQGGNVGDIRIGSSGAGGGAGGCPGLAGSAGKGGGASVGVFLWNSPVTFVATEIVANRGGAGGVGTLGSDPSAGDLGGIGTYPGTESTAGGAGGAAGVSASGAGGPSFAIAHSGGAPSLDKDSSTKAGSGGAGVAQKSKSTSLGDAKTLPASAPGASEGVHAL